MTKKESLIHVKLETEEAIEDKRNLLMSKADIIELVHAIKRYHKLRNQELKLKIKIYNKIKIIKNDLKRLQTNLPKIKLNQIPHHHIQEKPNSSEIRNQIKSQKTNNVIDRELEEIQRKLRELSA